MRPRHPTWHPHGSYYSFINGKRINLGKNYRKAKIKLKGLEKDLASKALEVAKGRTTMLTVDGKKDVHVKELAVKYLAWVKEKRSASTFDSYQRFVCHFLNWIGNKMVREITIMDFENYHTFAQKHHGRGLNAGYQAMRNIKTMFRWGEEFEICDCPVRRFPRVGLKPPVTKKFTKEEIAKVLQVVRPDFADLIKLSIMTGLRPIELRTLRRSQLDDSNGTPTLRIEHHKTSESSKSHAPRSVPLSPVAYEILKRQVAKHPKSEFVFLDGRNGPYERNALRKRLDRACRRASLSGRPPYAWRHFFGTMQAASGTNLAIVAQIMGHSNLQTTARYIANNDEAHIKAVSVMEKFI